MQIPNSIREILISVPKQFASISDSNTLDCQILLEHTINKNRAWILAYPEYVLTTEESNLFNSYYEQYSNRVPLPYIIKKWEFYGLEFFINENVLIPRPETEMLVENALDFISTFSTKIKICEVGIGSGCISVALAKNSTDIQIIATDISTEAIQVAKQNVAFHQVDKVVTIEKNDLMDNINDSFELIVANLPYIPTDEVKKLAIFGKEPTLALDGGSDGFDLIRRLLQQAVDKICEGGLILLEIEADHGEISKQSALDYFPHADISIKPDLTGRDRLLKIQT